MMPASHTGMPAGVVVSLLLIQLPADVPGKAMKDGPSAQATATHVGDSNRAPGFWFQSGPIWAVNKHIEDSPLTTPPPNLSLLVYVTLSNTLFF